jgi:hypothetical protein
MPQVSVSIDTAITFLVRASTSAAQSGLNPTDVGGPLPVPEQRWKWRRIRKFADKCRAQIRLLVQRNPTLKTAPRTVRPMRLLYLEGQDRTNDQPRRTRSRLTLSWLFSTLRWSWQGLGSRKRKSVRLLLLHRALNRMKYKRVYMEKVFGHRSSARRWMHSRNRPRRPGPGNSGTHSLWI